MDYLKLTAKLLEHEPKRSAAFQQGMARVLQNRVDETPVSSPYADGSVENDAFFAGRMRGHNEFRNLLTECNGSRTEALARLQKLAAVVERSAA
ncbi:MAG TPA: hypothetical protein VGC62_04615 [Pseudomonas sp.]|uniref:hypothetical protein n=1 Tax=Pseudomonas sp. TaxID=306 RepID=UPI002ED7CE23